MSETEQRETEYVAGVIEGIIQKGADKWQVAVKPDGSQYSKKLWTKDAELVAALSAKIGSHGAFVCGASHWTNNEGKPVRSLWIDNLGENRIPDAYITPPNANVSPSTAPQIRPAHTEAMTPEKWDAKERRDYRSRAWAQTLGAFTHTIKTDEEPTAVFDRLLPFQRAVFKDVCGSFAFPADESDIPF